MPLYQRVVTATGATTSRSFADHAGDAPNIEDWRRDAAGVTRSDTDTLKAAADASASLGRYVSGSGRTYNVSGNVVLISGTKLSDLTVVQLTPNDVARRTLTNSGAVSGIRLRRVKVNRGGNGTYGTPGESGGMFFDGISDFLLEDCEVTGDDKGVGIMLRNATDGRLVRPYVHTMAFFDTAATDDRLNGIYLETCTRVHIETPIVKNLSGNAGGSTSSRYTRGITVVGTEDCSIDSPKVDSVDQGVDVSGGYNRGLSVIGGHLAACRTFGLKFANGSVGCRAVGTQARECGLAGFVVSGPSTSGLTSKTHDIDLIGCEAVSVGSNGVYAVNDIAGFSVQPGAFDTDYPHGVRLIGCKAIDEQAVPTMKKGFQNTVSLAATGRVMNEAVECISVGHTVETGLGSFHSPAALVTRVAPQSIVNATQTAVVWTNEVYDKGQQHAANSSMFAITRDGWYRVSAIIHWAANATGTRTAQILLNGSAIGGTVVTEPARSAAFTQSVAADIYCQAGQNLRVEVTQDSGAALDVLSTYSAFSLTQLRLS